MKIFQIGVVIQGLIISYLTVSKFSPYRFNQIHVFPSLGSGFEKKNLVFFYGYTVIRLCSLFKEMVGTGNHNNQVGLYRVQAIHAGLSLIKRPEYIVWLYITKDKQPYE